MVSRYLIHDWLIIKESGSLIHRETAEQRRLGEYQLKLLLVLAERAGQVITREELTQLVWENRVIGNNSLPNAIHALRNALNDNGKQQRIIKTLPRKGYSLEAKYCRLLPPEEVPLWEEAETRAEDRRADPDQQEKTPGRHEARFWRWLSLMLGMLLSAAVIIFCF